MKESTQVRLYFFIILVLVAALCLCGIATGWYMGRADCLEKLQNGERCN